MTIVDVLDGFDERDWRSDGSGTVRFAMIGLGWWTLERSMPAVDSSELCETTVVVSGDRGQAASVMGRHETVDHGVTYKDFHDGAAASAYDAIYIGTPNALHLPFAETAARLGKHVLCEKPMESSVDRAERVRTVCEESAVRLMIGYRMQTDPLIRRMRELIRAGAIGDPVYVNGHMTQPLLEMIPDPDQWRLDPSLAGPGCSVTDLGIYPINTARFVLEAEPDAVTAEMRSESPEFSDVPDEWARFELLFDDGPAVGCAVSQNATQSGRFEVIGTEGSVGIEPAFFGDDRRKLTIVRGSTTATVRPDPVDQMVEEFEYFSDRVLSGGNIHPDGAHGVQDVRIIESIYDAATQSNRYHIR